MGHNLRTLTLHVSWIPDGSVDLPAQFENEGKATRFTEEHARTLMLQTRLRSIGIGDQSYTGRWVHRECSAEGTQDTGTEENVVLEVVGDPFV